MVRTMSFATSLGEVSAKAARLLMAPLGPGHAAKALASLSENVAPVMRVATEEGTLLFRCPTSEAVRLPRRFNSWEPMTFRWLREAVSPDACFWDIGAHIGVFTLTAGLRARAGGGTVAAFEPSAASFAALNDNLMLNGLQETVAAYGIALSDKTGVGRFHMTDPRAANAGHAFGEPVAYGRAFAPKYAQSTYATTIDEAVRTLGLPRPDFIKLDVDSIEDRILAGGARTLETVRSVLVEIEPERSAEWTQRVRAILARAGLHPDARYTPDQRHSNYVFSRT
jgi:FkbM family methyltransferase